MLQRVPFRDQGHFLAPVPIPHALLLLPAGPGTPAVPHRGSWPGAHPRRHRVCVMEADTRAGGICWLLPTRGEKALEDSTSLTQKCITLGIPGSLKLEKISKMHKSNPCCKPSFWSDQMLVLSPAACPQHRKGRTQGEKSLFTWTQSFFAHSKT